MLKKVLLFSATLLLISACGSDPNEIIKVSKKDCFFQVIGHDKVGEKSAAIVQFVNSPKIIQIPIKNGHIPDMNRIRGKSIKGSCVNTIARSGDRVETFEADMPTIAHKGDSNAFDAH
jgi:hypothetical protein